MWHFVAFLHIKRQQTEHLDDLWVWWQFLCFSFRADFEPTWGHRCRWEGLNIRTVRPLFLTGFKLSFWGLCDDAIVFIGLWGSTGCVLPLSLPAYKQTDNKTMHMHKDIWCCWPITCHQQSSDPFTVGLSVTVCLCFILKAFCVAAGVIPVQVIKLMSRVCWIQTTFISLTYGTFLGR